MDNYLQEGIAAAKAGDKTRAFQLLSRAAQDNATAEQAWLWLSSVVNTDEERLFCLGNVLRINPNHQHAKPAATMLRQKGVFPKRADLPQHLPRQPYPRPTAALKILRNPQFPFKTLLHPHSSRMMQSDGWDSVAAAHEGKPVELVVGKNEIENDMSGHFKYAAIELANNKPPLFIVKELTNRGVQPEMASRIVNETQSLLKKARGEKHRKRMTRGAMWTIAGLVLTCGSYIFASEAGGSYVLCYGAIIFGLIDFFVGLVGWLSSQ